MRKATLIILTITCISCENERKQSELKKDKINTEKSSSIPDTNNEKTINSSKILESIKWITETKKMSETEYELIVKAEIEKGYHLLFSKST